MLRDAPGSFRLELALQHALLFEKCCHLRLLEKQGREEEEEEEEEDASLSARVALPARESFSWSRCFKVASRARALSSSWPTSWSLQKLGGTQKKFRFRARPGPKISGLVSRLPFQSSTKPCHSRMLATAFSRIVQNSRLKSAPAQDAHMAANDSGPEDRAL